MPQRNRLLSGGVYGFEAAITIQRREKNGKRASSAPGGEAGEICSAGRAIRTLRTALLYAIYWFRSADTRRGSRQWHSNARTSRLPRSRDPHPT
jgi:hypothetical protein